MAGLFWSPNIWNLKSNGIAIGSKILSNLLIVSALSSKQSSKLNIFDRYTNKKKQIYPWNTRESKSIMKKSKSVSVNSREASPTNHESHLSFLEKIPLYSLHLKGMMKWNIATENWCEVSNVILKHAECAPELKKGINKVILKEFIEYLKLDCMFVVQKILTNWLSF